MPQLVRRHIDLRRVEAGVAVAVAVAVAVERVARGAASASASSRVASSGPAGGRWRIKGVNRWQAKRPFWWGLLLILDRDASEVPELGEPVVSHSKHGVAIKVLHAQDVDLSGYEPAEIVPPAQVHVEMQIGRRPASDVSFSGTIDVPSGVLTVGDAEQDESLQIGAGRWAVQVDCEPPEHAQLVRIWLQRE
jgi:hypothetical protein